MSKNLNQVDIGGPERGSCLETGFPSLSGNAASACHDNRAGIRGSLPSDLRSYPPVVLIGSNYTCTRSGRLTIVVVQHSTQARAALDGCSAVSDELFRDD
jgi:hypothetical protein